MKDTEDGVQRAARVVLLVSAAVLSFGSIAALLGFASGALDGGVAGVAASTGVFVGSSRWLVRLAHPAKVAPPDRRALDPIIGALTSLLMRLRH